MLPFNCFSAVFAFYMFRILLLALMRLFWFVFITHLLYLLYVGLYREPRPYVIAFDLYAVRPRPIVIIIVFFSDIQFGKVSFDFRGCF